MKNQCNLFLFLFLFFLIFSTPVWSQPFSVTYDSGGLVFSQNTTCKPCDGKNLYVHHLGTYQGIGLILTKNGNMIASSQFPEIADQVGIQTNGNNKTIVTPLLSGSTCYGYIVIFTMATATSGITPYILRFDKDLNLMWQNTLFPVSSTTDRKITDLKLYGNKGVVLFVDQTGGGIAEYDLTTGSLIQSKTMAISIQGTPQTSIYPTSIVKLNTPNFTYPGQYAVIGYFQDMGNPMRSFIGFLDNSFNVVDQYYYNFSSTTQENIRVNNDILEKDGILYISGLVKNANQALYNFMMAVDTQTPTVGDVLSSNYYDITSTPNTASFRHSGMQFSPSGNNLIIAATDLNSNKPFLMELDLSGNINWSKEYSYNGWSFGMSVSNSNICLCGFVQQGTPYSSFNIRTDITGDVSSSCSNNIALTKTSFPVDPLSVSIQMTNTTPVGQDFLYGMEPLSSNQAACLMTSTDDEKRLTRLISVFPNPVKEELNISNDTGHRIEEISIYAMTGQLLFHTRNFNNKVYTGSFKSGYYLVKIVIGHQTLAKKFIKI